MRKNLKLREAAEILGTSERTMYKIIAEGQITAFKVRGTLRIPEECLEEYRLRQTQKYREENGIHESSIILPTPAKS